VRIAGATVYHEGTKNTKYTKSLNLFVAFATS